MRCRSWSRTSAGLAAHLGHQRFTLVAHDWGGAVAWVFAMMHPGMLERLVLINAPHPGVFARELRENPAQQKASQYMLLFRSPEAEPCPVRRRLTRRCARRSATCGTSASATRTGGCIWKRGRGRAASPAA